jgi:ribose transport system substrate-binding protein
MQKTVHIVTYAGTLFALQDIEQKNVIQMDVGESETWSGWSIMDQALRLMAGLSPSNNEVLPLRIFDSSNVAQTGTPPVAGKGYGSNYVGAYEKLWGLSS